MSQQAHVDENLMAQHVDVQFVGHIPDQLHKQLALVQLG